MSRGTRLIAVIIVGLLAAGVASVVSEAQVAELIILGAGLVAGELFDLRPVGRRSLPLSFAVVVVLTRATTPVGFVTVAVAAYAVAATVRIEPVGLVKRSMLLGERLLTVLAAGVAYRLVLDATTGADRRLVVLTALFAAAVGEIVVHDVLVAVRARRMAVVQRSDGDLALIASALLMAMSYRGIAGEGSLGLWGPLLFSIPLVATWYSFELLASTRRGFRQTVQALGSVPEFGGLVREGHVERVADLAVAMGHELDFSHAELENLETAALLHHLGAVCLDEPPAGQHLDPLEVAEASAAMLRVSEAFSPAGDIVAAEPSLHRPPTARGALPVALAGQVLKVASAFDELTEGSTEHAAWAIEALYTGPSYVYDGRALGALERVALRRGLLAV